MPGEDRSVQVKRMCVHPCPAFTISTGASKELLVKQAPGVKGTKEGQCKQLSVGY
jgi:hypothetical protein